MVMADALRRAMVKKNLAGQGEAFAGERMMPSQQQLHVLTPKFNTDARCTGQCWWNRGRSIRTCEVIWCTPEMARQLRANCHFERQRDIDPRNVERLRIEMERGRFIEGTQVYFCVLPDDTTVIVNGNHTLEAVAAGMKPVLLSFCYRPTADMDEAGAIYARFDLQKVRNWRANWRARGLTDLLDKPNWIEPFGASLLHMLTGFKKPFHGDVELMTSRDIRAELVKDNYEYADLYIAAVVIGENKETTRYLRRSGVMGVGIELMRYQPTKAVEFFSAISKDDGLTKGRPERALLHYLRGNSTENHTARELQSRAVMLAWNAFFSGRQIEFCKPGVVAEFRLLGTPWRTGFDPIKTYAPHLNRSPSPVTSELRKPANRQRARDYLDEPVADNGPALRVVS